MSNIDKIYRKKLAHNILYVGRKIFNSNADMFPEMTIKTINPSDLIYDNNMYLLVTSLGFNS